MIDSRLWRSALLAGAAVLGSVGALPAQAQDGAGLRAAASTQLAQAEERSRGRWGERRERGGDGGASARDGDWQARREARQEQRERRFEARADARAQAGEARAHGPRAAADWRARRADERARFGRQPDAAATVSRERWRERAEGGSALERAQEASRQRRYENRAAAQRSWRDGDDRRGWHDDGRHWNDDGRRWRENDRRWRDDGRHWNHDGRRWSSDRRRWNDGWRRDRRYDWSGYRSYNRNVYRLGRYHAPYRNYYYRPLNVGLFLEPLFFSQRYWIDDPWQYRLPPAYGAYRWVRYYDDVLLIDVYSGEVVDVVYDFFW